MRYLNSIRTLYLRYDWEGNPPQDGSTHPKFQSYKYARKIPKENLMVQKVMRKMNWISILFWEKFPSTVFLNQQGTADPTQNILDKIILVEHQEFKDAILALCKEFRNNPKECQSTWDTQSILKESHSSENRLKRYWTYHYLGFRNNRNRS